MNTRIFHKMLDFCTNYIRSDRIQIFKKGTFSLSEMANNKDIFRNINPNDVTITEGYFSCAYKEDASFMVAYNYAKTHKLSHKDVSFVLGKNNDKDVYAEFMIPENSNCLTKCVSKDNCTPGLKMICINLTNNYAVATERHIIHLFRLSAKIHNIPDGVNKDKFQFLLSTDSFKKLKGRCKVTGIPKSTKFAITDEYGNYAEGTTEWTYPNAMSVIPEYSNEDTRATFDIDTFKKFIKSAPKCSNVVNIYHDKYSEYAELMVWDDNNDSWQRCKCKCDCKSSFKIGLVLSQIKILMTSWDGTLYVDKNVFAVMLGCKYANSVMLIISKVTVDNPLPEDIERLELQDAFKYCGGSGAPVKIIPDIPEYPEWVEQSVVGQKPTHRGGWFFFFFFDD